MAVLDVFAWTPLFLVESISLNIQILNVEDMLVLSDSISTNQHMQSVRQLLHLNDEVNIHKTVGLSAASGLTLSQNGQRTPIIKAVVDYLDMYQSSQTYPQWPDVKQILALSHMAICVSAKGVYDTLTLTQSVQVEKTIAVHGANTLAMQNKATVYLPDQFWTSYDVVVMNP